MRLFLAGNPSANRGRAAQQLDQVEEWAGKFGLDFVLHRSRSAEHLAELSAGAREQGYDSVVACGGDGTVNGVMQALVGGQTALGIVPLGGGNDLAVSLGIGRDARRAVMALGKARRRAIDVVSAGQRFYCGVAGAGLDSKVNQFANERVRRFSGIWRYLYAALAELARFQPPRAEVEFDGSPFSGEIMLVAVANTQRYGGGFSIAPLAIDDDGLLDLIIVKKMSKAALMAHLPAIAFGLLRPSEKILFHRAHRIRIGLDADIELYADGERFGRLPVELKVVPRALEILVPESERCAEVVGSAGEKRAKE